MVLSAILCVLFYLIFGFSVICFILVTSFNFILSAAFSLIISVILTVLIAKRRQIKKRSSLIAASVITSVTGGLISLFLLSMGLPFRSSSEWRYRYQVFYCYRSHKAPDSFPVTIPDGVTDYKLDFLPSILQGQGHFTVSFTAPEEYTKQKTIELENAAEHVFKLSSIDIMDRKIREEDPDDSLRGLEIYLDDMERSHPDATVYLIKSNYYTHRPHTEAVLVDGNYFFFTDY